MPDGDLITPLTGISVVRADDLLDLAFEFRNLGLKRTGSPAFVRVVPGADAFVIVGFAPQSIGEAGVSLARKLSSRSRPTCRAPAVSRSGCPPPSRRFRSISRACSTGRR